MRVAFLLTLPSVAVIVTGFCPSTQSTRKSSYDKVRRTRSPWHRDGGRGRWPLRIAAAGSVTEIPPVGAAPLKVTVPVELAGAVTVVGLRVKFARAT